MHLFTSFSPAMYRFRSASLMGNAHFWGPLSTGGGGGAEKYRRKKYSGIVRVKYRFHQAYVKVQLVCGISIRFVGTVVAVALLELAFFVDDMAVRAFKIRSSDLTLCGCCGFYRIIVPRDKMNIYKSPGLRVCRRSIPVSLMSVVERRRCYGCVGRLR